MERVREVTYAFFFSPCPPPSVPYICPQLADVGIPNLDPNEVQPPHPCPTSARSWQMWAFRTPIPRGLKLDPSFYPPSNETQSPPLPPLPWRNDGNCSTSSLLVFRPDLFSPGSDAYIAALSQSSRYCEHCDRSTASATASYPTATEGLHSDATTRLSTTGSPWRAAPPPVPKAISARAPA